MALTESKENKERWRWRWFSIGGMMGLAFGVVYIGVPAVTGAILAKPIRLIPIPWVDFTEQFSRFLPATPLNLTAVAFGNGQFVAASSNGRILTSTTGSAWNVFEARPGDTAVYAINNLAFSGARWVAAGSRNAGAAAEDVIVTLYSADAVTWSVGAAGFAGELHGVAWGAGRFVTVGEIDIGTAENVALILSSP